MSAEDFLSSRIWRSQHEGAELVERLIRAERRARIAEQVARAALAEHPRDEITHLATRIIELEDQCERLNRRLAAKNRKGAA